MSKKRLDEEWKLFMDSFFKDNNFYMKILFKWRLKVGWTYRGEKNKNIENSEYSL
jgi:hypothetical protein